MSSSLKPGSLMVRIDPQSDDPLQQQIYAGVRGAILQGILRPGLRIPSSRALAVDLNVSRTTVLGAIDQLLSEGYLTTRHGSGTFIATELPEDLPSSPTLAVTARVHPPFSGRGDALAALPPAARRVPGTPPRPFRIGVPAVDLVPVRVWSQLVHRRLSALSASHLDYGDPMGHPELRSTIAEHLRLARGTRCRADEVVIAAGAQHALNLICRVLLDPGDDVWLEEPGYPGARAAFLAAGACVHPVPVGPDGLEVGEAVRLAPDARMVYVTPSHQFPLGVPMSLPRRLALLKWASAARAWVLEDDYDSEFRYGERPIPCLHGLDADGRVIYVGSFSKTLFPSLRLGFLIVPADLREKLSAVRRSSEIHPPYLEQAVLADFIGEGHFARHLRRMQAVYRERMEAVVDAAASIGGDALRVRPARTGLHLVADLEGADARLVFQTATSAGIEVMPLSDYYFGGRPHNGLVLGFGTVRPEDARPAMEKLVAAITQARRAAPHRESA